MKISKPIDVFKLHLKRKSGLKMNAEFIGNKCINDTMSII